MKLQNIFRLASVAVASGSMLLGVTSCNYLDVAFAVKFALKEQALAYAGVILIPEFVMAGSGSIGGLGVEPSSAHGIPTPCRNPSPWA